MSNSYKRFCWEGVSYKYLQGFLGWFLGVYIIHICLLCVVEVIFWRFLEVYLVDETSHERGLYP